MQAILRRDLCVKAVHAASLEHNSDEDNRITEDQLSVLESLQLTLSSTPSCVENVLLNKEELGLLSDYLEEV